MTINNQEAFIDSLWDWGILRGCFGDTKIAPTDIDGLVERRGKFLVLEAKGEGVHVKQGQGLTLEALCRTGLFTVIIVWGDKNKPTRLQRWDKAGPGTPRPCDLVVFRQEVASWFEEVEAAAK
jgi:hypothetical protein